MRATGFRFSRIASVSHSMLAFTRVHIESAHLFLWLAHVRNNAVLYISLAVESVLGSMCNASVLVIVEFCFGLALLSSQVFGDVVFDRWSLFMSGKQKY